LEEHQSLIHFESEESTLEGLPEESTKEAAANCRMEKRQAGSWAFFGWN